MRQRADDQAASALGGGTGTPAGPASPLRPLHVAVAAACFLVAPYLGFDGFTVDPRISEVWPLGGVGFVLLTTVWSTSPRWRVLTLTLMTLVTWVTAVAVGLPLARSGWIALTATLQPLLMVLAYRRVRGDDGWRPRRASDLGALLLAAAGSATLVGVLGGYPRLEPSELPSLVLVWWVLRTLVFAFVGAALFTVLFAPRSEEHLEPGPWWNTVLLVPATVLFVIGTYHDPTQPYSWLLVVPSVWAGLTLTVRGTAWATLGMALLAASMTYVPSQQFGYDGTLPAASLVDLLVTASTGFALLLALMREQRARLIDELARQGHESERQRLLLSRVLDSMHEGVLVLGRDGLRTHNAAARQLLGRPLPRDPAVAWGELYGITDARGRPLSETDLRDLLRSPGSDAQEVRLDDGDRARVLEVVVERLGPGLAEDDDRSRLVLLRDVTVERERLRELSAFAGLVAHDLRGPLTVLDGWLEVGLDPETEADEAQGALQRAYAASQRMRQVIEDWVGYTLVQHGQPHPQPVALAELVATLLASRHDGDGDAGGPRVSTDLPHTVRADTALLRQLLDNLVDNAVKYTAPGRQPVVAVSSYDDEEAGWVRVEVYDEGMGVPPGQEETIFEEFRRGPSEGRSVGTGLGLSLTRRIVEMHGGRIWARRNDEGPGSTFAFTLPAA